MITLIDDKTYKIKNCGDVSAKIVIGGNNKDKFIPNLNVGYSFGGGEEYYDNLNRTDKITTSKSDLRFDGSKITLIEGGDIDEIYTDGQGRLKWDVVFESCPESMTLEWKRKCSNGLTAHYQDTLETDWLSNSMGLSLEEYLATHHRPDEVIGSYAIYCNKAHNYIKPKDKKKEIPANWKTLLSGGAALADVNIDSYREYKTGKVGHSYRPFVIDANGKKEWCVMLFVDNAVRITLPEEFMKTAKYPVRLDPTIGYTTAGASNTYTDSNSRPWGSYYSPHTASSGDTLTAISVYGRKEYSTDSVMSFAAYTISGGHLASRLGSANSITFNSQTAQWWSTGTLSDSMSSGSVYGLAFKGITVSTLFYYDTGGTYSEWHSTNEALPATWSYYASVNYIVSLYGSVISGTSGHPAASRLRNISRNPYVRYN